jgi:hypothetical protein
MLLYTMTDMLHAYPLLLVPSKAKSKHHGHRTRASHLFYSLSYSEL